MTQYIKDTKPELRSRLLQFMLT